MSGEDAGRFAPLITMLVELRMLDLVAVAIYLGGMVLLGLYFARRNINTEEYFVGNRAFPGWAIGLSMLGTTISSVTFLAFPAAAFALDWRLIVPNLLLPAVAVVAVLVFIPFFRRGRLTSAFEYLGDRYGPLARLYGTISYLILALLRLGKFLFLAAIPISILTDAPISLVIVLAGVFIAVYTILGGIDAVIWSDVIQAVVLALGGIACLIFISGQLPDGLMQILSVGSEHGKFNLGSTEWNLNERTFWTVMLLGIFTWLAFYSSDQNVIQRYAASKSTREARKATITFSLVAVPTWAFFFFLGTALFVYYVVFPDPKVLGLEADQVFPYFILSRLPAGLAGLVIAAVLAAAMSSLDSSINAIATITVVDILRPYLLKSRSDRFYLRTAQVIATVASLFMIAGAIFFSQISKESMADLGWIIASVFGGCLAGLFLMGFFTTRVDYGAVLFALPIAVLVNLYLMLNSFGWLPNDWSVSVHSYWTGLLVNLVFAVLVYLISLFRRRPAVNLEGLTIWTI